MRRRDLEACLQRDWARVAGLKDAHWRRRTERRGLAGMLRIADELRWNAKAADPGWPAAEDREEDLEDHGRVAAQLARVPRLPRRAGRRR